MEIEEGEEDYQETLVKHHWDIVKCLDLDRQYILSHLRSKFILDDEDCQLIKSGASRQQQAAKFIDVLTTKGPKGFLYFIEACEIEHPHLYEKITGNEAVRQSGVNLQDRHDLSIFDESFLIQELRKATDNTRSTLYQHEKSLHEKKAMAQKLEDVERELQERETLIKDLRNALQSKADIEEREKLLGDVQAYANQVRNLSRSHLDQSYVIIKLQSQLLAAKESFEQFRKTNENLLRKNENLMEQVRDLTINYDFQRTQSKRLSKQVDLNNSELKQVADAKREMHALRFELARIKEERDEVLHNLDDVREKNAELQSVCELLQKEKSNAEEGKGKVSVTLMKLEAANKQLESNLHDEHNKSEMYKRRNERLLEEMDALKEQRDFYIQERELAIEERDTVMQELDDCVRLKQDMQKSRDAAVQKQIKMVGQSEKKNSSLLKEIDRLTVQLDEYRIKNLLMRRSPTIFPGDTPQPSFTHLNPPSSPTSVSGFSPYLAPGDEETRIPKNKNQKKKLLRTSAANAVVYEAPDVLELDGLPVLSERGRLNALDKTAAWTKTRTVSQVSSIDRESKNRCGGAAEGHPNDNMGRRKSAPALYSGKALQEFKVKDPSAVLLSAGSVDGLES